MKERWVGVSNATVCWVSRLKLCRRLSEERVLCRIKSLEAMVKPPGYEAQLTQKFDGCIEFRDTVKHIPRGTSGRGLSLREVSVS